MTRADQEDPALSDLAATVLCLAGFPSSSLLASSLSLWRFDTVLLNPSHSTRDESMIIYILLQKTDCVHGGCPRPS